MDILVSGAGMAGLSAGLTLGATGHHVTVVERADRLRTGGSPIDIRGDALAVIQQLGLLEPIQRHQVTMTERSQFIDARGRVLAELPVDEVSDSADDIEIPERIWPCAARRTQHHDDAAVQRFDRDNAR